MSASGAARIYLATVRLDVLVSTAGLEPAQVCPYGFKCFEVQNKSLILRDNFREACLCKKNLKLAEP
jgi:hypothetical protein